MRTIQLTTSLTDQETDQLKGRFLTDQNYTQVIGGEDTAIYKPDGSVLLKLITGRIPVDMAAETYAAMKDAATATTNRGYAAGQLDEKGLDEHRPIAERSGTRYRVVKGDGTVSNTTYAAPVNSGITGFFDRNARFPYCRQTQFTADHPDKFARALPYFHTIDRIFAEHMPERHQAQMELIARTVPDYVIPGTSFTTVSVNRNWQTAVHKDAGDLKAGFGIIACLRYGYYQGCYTCFPKYKVAVDLQCGDVLLADVHEWHGNTPFIGTEAALHQRLTFVLYYKEGVKFCERPADELKRASNRRQGSAINDEEGPIRPVTPDDIDWVLAIIRQTGDEAAEKRFTDWIHSGMTDHTQWDVILPCGVINWINRKSRRRQLSEILYLAVDEKRRRRGVGRRLLRHAGNATLTHPEASQDLPKLLKSSGWNMTSKTKNAKHWQGEAKA